MTETDLPGPGLDECPTCEQEYRSLAQHWVKSSTCEYPEIGDSLHQVIRGCLLGDGGVDGRERAMVEIQSTNRQVAEWYHEQLDWLSRGVTQDSSGVYRVRTMSHPSLDEYWTWADEPRSGWDLTPAAARVWYVSDGTIEFGKANRPYISFAATDDAERAAKRRLLNRAGFETREWERRIVIAKDDIDDWLDWIGEPVQGVEYKWASNRVVYQTLRTDPTTETEYKSELARNALQIARKRTDEELTPEEFDTLIDATDADSVADVLGGGSFDDACSVANVDTDSRSATPPGSNFPEDYSGTQKRNYWNEETILEAVGGWAEGAEKLTTTAYREASRGDEDLPNITMIYQHYESWADVVELATDDE